MKRYRITRSEWETYCAWCGSDLLMGDLVTMDRSDNTFCGAECCRSYADDRQTREVCCAV